MHVYAAIWVRGTIGAMTRGKVTGGWAWRHHRRWLRELVTGKPARAELAAPAVDETGAPRGPCGS